MVKLNRSMSIEVSNGIGLCEYMSKSLVADLCALSKV